jgi:hypothetical protein
MPSNGYCANGRVQRSVGNATVPTARAEVRAGAKRRTGQWTVPVRCTTEQSGGPTCQSSNGRTLTVGWRGWCTGQCPVAHRTVRCALRLQPSPTATLMVGAINTPNHHTSRHPSFQPTHSIQELVHSIQDTNRVNKKSLQVPIPLKAISD